MLLHATLPFLLPSPPRNKLSSVTLTVGVGETLPERVISLHFTFLELFKLNLSIKIKLLLPAGHGSRLGLRGTLCPEQLKCPLNSSPTYLPDGKRAKCWAKGRLGWSVTHPLSDLQELTCGDQVCRQVFKKK